MKRSRFTEQHIAFALQQAEQGTFTVVWAIKHRWSISRGLCPRTPEFNALGESEGAGKRKAEPIRLCPSVIHPPRRSGCPILQTGGQNIP
jgi:hypothetical protein